MRVSIIVRACYRNEAISREIYAALCQVSYAKEIQVLSQEILENLILRYVKNKGADQTVHSLISFFVVLCLDSSNILDILAV